MKLSSRNSKEDCRRFDSTIEINYKKLLRIFAKIILLAGIGSTIYFGYYLHKNDYSPGRPARTNIENQPLYEGVNYSRIIREFPRPQVIHLLEIDFDKVNFFVTPHNSDMYGEQFAQTTNQFLETNDLQIAVNANFFTKFKAVFPIFGVYPQIGDPVQIQGQVISSSQEYSPPLTGYPVFCILEERAVVYDYKCPNNTQFAVSGNRLLIDQGEIIPDLDTKYEHPRIGIGISKDGKTIYIIGVDGRQGEYSFGLSLKEFAENALEIIPEIEVLVNMDGGGSFTIVKEKNGFLNSPFQTHIQGLPRPVATHIGIQANELAD